MIGQTSPDPAAADDTEAPPPQDAIVTTKAVPPRREVGGRDGLDPTRYGDWEKNGRCIDF
ncbi:MAG: DUF1674 domain-containing protein [Proteobacteria bacterium]|nr:DUF1674 domain-containing protein [Pseudomonadota bacterium]